MTEADAHPDWDDSYAGPPPPWDIGRPQAAFVRLAEAGALTGALLDAGCGTGEHTILAARTAPAPWASTSRHAPSRSPAARPPSAASTPASRCSTRSASTPSARPSTPSSTAGCSTSSTTPTRSRYVTAVHAALRPGGHLHLMCFSDRQPGDWGPRRVTEDELRAAFGSGWRIDLTRPRPLRHQPGPR